MKTFPIPTRRRFVQGLAAGGALAALGGWRAASAGPRAAQ
ncbi:twin-arginine translocation signal domain-containing protein, partial [Achromobacter xylosoxidans]